MGITGRPRYDAGLVDHQIVRLDILAASPRPFSPAERRSGIGLRVLCERDLLVLDRGYQSRLTLDAALRLLSLSPSIRHEGGSGTVILALARAGLGTAVIPATTRTDLHTAKFIANGQIDGAPNDPITLIKDGRIHYRDIPKQQSLEDWNEFWQEYKNAS